MMGLLLLGLVAAGGAGLPAGKPAPPKPVYPLTFASFEVQYRVSGIQRGTEALAVLDHGRVLLVHVHDTLPDGTVTDSLRVVLPEGGVQVINGDTLPLTIGWAFVERFIRFKLWRSLATGTPPAEGARFEPIGHETLLGKRCTTYDTYYLRRPTQISAYRGIPLLYVWMDSTATGSVVNEKRAVYLGIEQPIQDPVLRAALGLVPEASTDQR